MSARPFMSARRPRTALGCVPTPTSVDGQQVVFVDTDTKVAPHFSAAPGLRSTLEDYYDKASAADRAKCLELMTSMDMGDAFKSKAKHLEDNRLWYHNAPRYVTQNGRAHRPTRPKTAVAAYNYGDGRDDGFDPHNPYTTSYEMHYPHRPEVVTQAHRPASTKHFFRTPYDLSGPTTQWTHYKEQFGVNREGKPANIIKGTGSYDSNSSNQPHPLQPFMTWRHPRDGKVTPKGITPEQLDKAMRGSMRTVYQLDYLGYPPGIEKPPCGDDVDDDWEQKVPYTLDSNHRQAYQQIDRPPILKNTTSRYASNTDKHRAASGVLPLAARNKVYMNLKTRTAYDTHYNDPVHDSCPDVRTMAQVHAPTSLRKQALYAGPEAQADISAMLPYMDPAPPVPQPPTPPTPPRDPHMPREARRRVIGVTHIHNPRIYEELLKDERANYPMPGYSMELAAY